MAHETWQVTFGIEISGRDAMTIVIVGLDLAQGLLSSTKSPPSRHDL
jgi:hypothetical protein